jgi:antirestriction protein ArdC
MMAYDNTRLDVYDRVTNRIVESLEQGVRPWSKPWGTTTAAPIAVRPLRVSGEAYRGINTIMLWGEAWSKGYLNPTWMTFQQAKEFGACVRKGEHGSLVVYANKIIKHETNSEGDEVERAVAFLKGYTVFNCEQIDGLPERFTIAGSEPLPVPAFERVEHAESFVRSTGAVIAHGGDKAFFMPSQDRIQVPPFAAFKDAESYYATLLHELTHWTHGPNRLVREFGRKRWGDEGYAAEELVAELGAAFLCADLSISIEPRADHASYIESWLRVLKHDKRAIFTAASYAQASSDYLHSLQAEQQTKIELANAA